MVRKILAICLILILFSTLTAAAGYSSATVDSEATLKIVASEDALLAVEEIQEFDPDVNEISALTKRDGNLAFKPYRIRNNSSNTMKVKLECQEAPDGTRVFILVKGEPMGWKRLKPGKDIEVLVMVTGGLQPPADVSLRLRGKWDGGSAMVWWSLNAGKCQMLPEGDESLEDTEETSFDVIYGETIDEQTEDEETSKKDEERSKGEETSGEIKDQKGTKDQEDIKGGGIEKRDKDAGETGENDGQDE